MRIVIAVGGNALLERGQQPDAGVQKANVGPGGGGAGPARGGARAGRHPRQRSAGRPARPRVRGGPAARAALPVRRPRRADPGHDRVLAAPGTAERAARPPGRRRAQPDPGLRRRPRLRAPDQVRRPGLRRGDRRGSTRPRARLERHAGRRPLAPGGPVAATSRVVRDPRRSGPARLRRGRRLRGRRRRACRPSTGRQAAGVEAVVDKDLTAALLAASLDADALLLLTDVPAVVHGFGDPGGGADRRATPAALRREHFPPGRWGPRSTPSAASSRSRATWPRSAPWRTQR